MTENNTPGTTANECRVEGCTSPVDARDLCNAHYLRTLRFAMTIEEIEDFMAENGGLCEICQVRDSNVIDHDHGCCPGRYTCGECIRGALCAGCNVNLGILEKKAPEDRRDTDWKRKAEAYVAHAARVRAAKERAKARVEEQRKAA